MIVQRRLEGRERLRDLASCRGTAPAIARVIDQRADPPTTGSHLISALIAAGGANTVGSTLS